jgi:hypothetical protein
MRRIALAAVCLTAAASLLALLGGCSGTGAPAEPSGLADLRAVAADHVTALLMVERWLRALYPGSIEGAVATCTSSREERPLLPGDPIGARRYHFTYPDCTTNDALLLPDGSGSQEFTYTDNMTKSVTWDPVVRTGTLREIHLHEIVREGADVTAELDYTLSFRMGVDGTRRLGTARLPDGRETAFDHARDEQRDRLEVRPYDGSRLSVETPLEHLPGGDYRPLVAQGSAGTYEAPGGRRLTFELSGSAGGRWERWSFQSETGIVGRFGLDPDFSGSGRLQDGPRTVATLSWSADGEGDLAPVGAVAVDVSPSAAARDFAIDRWIRNIAALGPMPVY